MDGKQIAEAITIMEKSKKYDELISFPKQREVYCSFCGLPQSEVKKLIVAPQVVICDQCVELCSEIINEVTEGADRSE